MFVLKYVLMILGVALYGSAGALVAYDVFLATQLRRLLRGSAAGKPSAKAGAPAKRRFRTAQERFTLQLAPARR